MCDSCNNIDLITRATDTLGVKGTLRVFIRKHIEILSEEWEIISEEAIDKALTEFNKKKDTDKGIAAALLILLSTFKNFLPKNKEKELSNLVSGIYTTIKTKAAKQNNTKFILTDLDKKFIKSIGREGPYWIGNVYETHMSNRIESVTKHLLEKGLTKEELGKQFGIIMENEFALRGGKSYLKEIPGYFSGNVENYNEIVTTTVAQRARVYGALSAISDGGYERFRYRAVGDKRTCPRCLELDGEEYAVQIAMNKMEAIANADSPEEFKALHPWFNSVDEIKALTNNQVPMPPIHGRCRCWVEAV